MHFFRHQRAPLKFPCFSQMLARPVRDHVSFQLCPRHFVKQAIASSYLFKCWYDQPTRRMASQSYGFMLTQVRQYSSCFSLSEPQHIWPSRRQTGLNLGSRLCIFVKQALAFSWFAQLNSSQQLPWPAQSQSPAQNLANYHRARTWLGFNQRHFSYSIGVAYEQLLADFSFWQRASAFAQFSRLSIQQISIQYLLQLTQIPASRICAWISS